MYCATATSATGDHVFPRKLFLPRHRANLPQVPACAPCNRAKSRIETYVTAILPFGGRHETARENLELQVIKRLRRNRKLATALVKGVRRKWSKYGDLIIPTTTIPIDPDLFRLFFQLVVRGLIWHHWKQILTDAHLIEVSYFTDHRKALFNARVVNLTARDRVEADLGEGTAVYQGAPDTDCPQRTEWKFAIAGFTVIAFTGPKSASIQSEACGH